MRMVGNDVAKIFEEVGKMNEILGKAIEVSRDMTRDELLKVVEHLNTVALKFEDEYENVLTKREELDAREHRMVTNLLTGLREGAVIISTIATSVVPEPEDSKIIRPNFETVLSGDKSA